MEFRSSNRDSFGRGRRRGRGSRERSRWCSGMVLNVKENRGRGSGQDHQDYGGECWKILMGHGAGMSKGGSGGGCGIYDDCELLLTEKQVVLLMPMSVLELEPEQLELELELEHDEQLV
ncbi:hypothetical protein Tco_1488023 [Tanacetum coccineum]